MRTNLLFLVALLFSNSGMAQQAIQTGTNLSIKIDPSETDKFITKEALDGKPGEDQSKHKICWLETGDGRFTTDPSKIYTDIGKQSHLPLMAVVSLYDTGKGPRPTIVNLNNQSLIGVGNAKINDNSILLDKILKISSNVKDIVEGDTMFFAVTYTLSPKKIGYTYTQEDECFLIFYYNNNKTFSPISETTEQKIDGNLIPSVRTHFEETPAGSVPDISNMVPALGKFNNSFALKLSSLNATNGSEMNFFITAIPESELEEGKSGSVYAAMVIKPFNSREYKVIALDSIINMPFEVAHDPNYMVQRPYCLKLPHKIYPFEYKIHFQNTGEGRADKIKIIAKFPMGLNWSTFKIKQATLAGKKYSTGPEFKYIIDKSKNIIEFHFIPTDPLNFLMGTGLNNINPAINPNTMGDIDFSVFSTSNTSDTLKSSAAIYFHSVGKLPDDYETPVFTNTETTIYKTCCDCSKCDCPSVGGGNEEPKVPGKDPISGNKSFCLSFLGLCWWWWIIVVLSSIILYLLWRNKKKNSEKNI